MCNGFVDRQLVAHCRSPVTLNPSIAHFCPHCLAMCECLSVNACTWLSICLFIWFGVCVCVCICACIVVRMWWLVCSINVYWIFGRTLCVAQTIRFTKRPASMFSFLLLSSKRSNKSVRLLLIWIEITSIIGYATPVSIYIKTYFGAPRIIASIYIYMHAIWTLTMCLAVRLALGCMFAGRVCVRANDRTMASALHSHRAYLNVDHLCA